MTTALSSGFRKYTPWASGSPTTTGIFGPADAVMKDFYLPGVRDLLNSKRIMSRYIRRNREDVAGQEAVISLNTARNEGIGHVGENAKLPDPEQQTYDRAIYRMRYYYGRIKISGPSVASSRNERGAFIRVLDGEIRGVARDMQHEFNRITFGDGSGRLCRFAATGAGVGPFPVNLPGGFANNQGLGTQYLRDGMRVSIMDTTASDNNPLFEALSSGETSFYIVNTDYTAGTVQFAVAKGGVAAATANAMTALMFLSRSSEAGSAVTVPDTAWLREPFGLAALVFDGNPFGGASSFLGGIDATAVPIWQSYVVGNGGTPQAFDQDLLQQAMDGADQLGDGVVNMLMTTHGIRRQYLNQLVANKRYVGTMKLDGGFKAIAYDDRPMVVDKDCTRGRIYCLDLSSLMIFYENDYHWADAHGSILRFIQDQDAYGATLQRYHQMGTDARNRSAVVQDIDDT